jgi:hypothetical protein
MSIGPPKGDSRPASAQRLQRDGAGGVNGSISLSSSPRAARQRPIWSHGTAPLTPRLGAPRPPSREHTPAHRSGGAATTPQCRPARVRPLKHLLLRPSNRRADLQPLRALPPRATSSALQTVPPAGLLTRASRAPGFRFFATVKGLTAGSQQGQVNKSAVTLGLVLGEEEGAVQLAPLWHVQGVSSEEAYRVVPAVPQLRVSHAAIVSGLRCEKDLAFKRPLENRVVPFAVYSISLNWVAGVEALAAQRVSTNAS